ncbi:MAG: glycosyltransferase family 2 protein [Mariprofundaceae bacterium]
MAVVISTYNAPNMLHLVLNAYAQQMDRNFALYIADDGSTDETRAVIADFRKKTPISIEHAWHADKGFRKARIHNRVIQSLQEDYILLTDGDCMPRPDLIAAHRKSAQKNCFVSGSRILMNQELSSRLQSEQHLDTKIPLTTLLKWRYSGQINRLLPLLMPVHAGSAHDKLAGIRGCHLACWRSDLCTINGFDEGFEGWGREDSDLVARLLHAGIRRVDMRGSPVLHLWHEEAPRQRLPENDAMLRQCLDSKRIKALKGLSELPPQ